VFASGGVDLGDGELLPGLRGGESAGLAGDEVPGAGVGVDDPVTRRRRGVRTRPGRWSGQREGGGHDRGNGGRVGGGGGRRGGSGIDQAVVGSGRGAVADQAKAEGHPDRVRRYRWGGERGLGQAVAVAVAVAHRNGPLLSIKPRAPSALSMIAAVR